MSKIIASAAIRGAHKIYNRVLDKYKQAVDKYGPDQTIGFPDTGYYHVLAACATLNQHCNRMLTPAADESTSHPLHIAPLKIPPVRGTIAVGTF